MKISASIIINKNAEVVWHYATDWKRHEKWVPHTTITIINKPHIDDNSAVGTSFMGATTIGPYTLLDPMIVTHSKKPVSNHDDTDMNLTVEGSGLYYTEKGELTVVKSGRRITGTAGFILTPQIDKMGSRITHVEWYEDVEFHIPVPQFIKKIMYKQFKKELVKVLERMKKDIEQYKEKVN